MLAHELVEPLAGNQAVPRGVDVHAMMLFRSLSVDQDAEADWPACRAAEDEVEVAGAELEGDAAAWGLRYRTFGLDIPEARECPVIELVGLRQTISVRAFAESFRRR